MSTQTYRTVIICDANGDGINEEYEADILEPVSETIRTEVTTHPLVEGNTLADHMIVEPMTMRLTGKFSLIGTKHTAYEGVSDRLATIQKTFESISKNGIFCTIVTLNKSEEAGKRGNIRFVQRDNMVLTNIEWTRGLNTLGFTFSFVEALTASVANEMEYEVDVRDKSLPTLTSGQLMSFSTTFLDWSQITQCCVKLLKDCDLITDEFLSYMATSESIKRLGIAIGAGVAVGGIAAYIAVASFGASVWPVGTIIVAAAAVTGALVWGVSEVVKAIKRAKYTIKQFKLYAEEQKNVAEVERFIAFTNQISKQIIKLDGAIEILGIPSEGKQELMTSIDDQYYTFVFDKNNTEDGDAPYTLKVLDINENVVGEQSRVAGLTHISQCTHSNALFRTPKTGTWVYIMNGGASKMEMNLEDVKKIEESQYDLRNYQILISHMDMEQYTNAVLDIIKNAVTQ